MTAMDLKAPGFWKEAAVWVAGGLAALFLCLLATFPYDRLHARVVAEVHRVTGMDVRVADWSVAVPLGLEWRHITLSKPQWEPVNVALLEARVGIIKALTGGAGLDLVARMDEGSGNSGLAQGTVTASSWSFGGPVAFKGRLQQIDLSKVVHRYVRQGLLSGDFTHRLDAGQSGAGQIKGDGTWRATVKDLTVDQIPVGSGRMLSLAFTNVSLALSCQDAVCTVTELKGEGLDGSFTGEGTITLHQPVQQSQLAMTVTVVPGAGFASKASGLGLPPLPSGTAMTLKIAGTVAQTRIAL